MTFSLRTFAKNVYELEMSVCGYYVAGRDLRLHQAMLSSIEHQFSGFWFSTRCSFDVSVCKRLLEQFSNQSTRRVQRLMLHMH